MASNAEILADTPAPLNGTSLDPYGQLLKMLLPRAHAIVVYDRLGVTVWSSEDNDDTELQALQQHAQAAEQAEPGAIGAGFAEPLPGEQIAYFFLLRDGAGVDARRRRHGEPRIEPRASAIHAGAWTAASGAAMPRARARIAVEHRRPAAQSRRARSRSRAAARRGAGGVGRRQLDGRLRQAGAGMRRPSRLRRRRAADSGQEHRRLPHGQRYAAARGRGDSHAHAPPGARLGAAAPADDDVQRARTIPARLRTSRTRSWPAP